MPPSGLPRPSASHPPDPIHSEYPCASHDAEHQRGCGFVSPARLIGLPAYNEELALPRVLGRIAQLIETLDAEIVVVVYNDGSTDDTASIAGQWQSRLPLVALDGVQNRGLGVGLRTLVEYAVTHGGNPTCL